MWISAAILIVTLPLFFIWCNERSQVRSFALADMAIGLESVVTVLILSRGAERSTRAPRLLMSSFLSIFTLIEFARAGVAFLLHTDPDIFSPRLELTSAVAYIVNTSLLPLAFIWMMNARLESDLFQQTVIDSLTHVFNRRGLDQALGRELARYRRDGNDLTLAILDLDHFKQLNDAHGHAAGDMVLTELANLLATRLRQTDVVGRIGGEEFVLLLPHTDLARSRIVLEHLCQILREHPFKLVNTPILVTASVGVTTTRGRNPVTRLQLLHEADVALYRAKKNGRDQVSFSIPEDETTGPSIPSFKQYSDG